jgi:hypothetical protein
VCADSIIACRFELARVLPRIKRQILHEALTLHAAIEAKLKDLEDLVQTASSQKSAGVLPSFLRLNSIMEEEEAGEDDASDTAGVSDGIASDDNGLVSDAAVSISATAAASEGDKKRGDILDKEMVGLICDLIDDMELDIDGLKEQVN